jgi:predicted transcriptional regulator
VHDLVGGRAAWTALGFPTEGQIGDARRIAQYVQTTPTVRTGATVAELASLEARFPIPVLADSDVVIGAVHPTARGLPPDTPVDDVMVPAPSTIRSEMRVDDVVRQLRRDGVDHVLVTTVAGRLVGLVVTDELHV